jgi:glyoxalase family protein
MITGIHHVTAISGEAQRNVDFYAGVLGLKLVKKTVNFDDPGTYHLYYGDGLGRPGTILTFFPWANAPKGRPGQGQVTQIILNVPDGSFGFWRERLRTYKIAVSGRKGLQEGALTFVDADGIALGIVEGGAAADGYGTLPGDVAIRRIGGVTMTVPDPARTANMLREVMGFTGGEPTQTPFRSGAGSAQDLVLVDPNGAEAKRGQMGPGAVHHIAFRVADDATQEAWREKLLGLGFRVSDVMDRNYFHSIYFREPGGVLFEIATDSPGFTVDETPEELGTNLKLPPQYEVRRADLERTLVPLKIPTFPEAG